MEMDAIEEVREKKKPSGRAILRASGNLLFVLSIKNVIFVLRLVGGGEVSVGQMIAKNII